MKHETVSTFVFDDDQRTTSDSQDQQLIEKTRKEQKREYMREYMRGYNLRTNQNKNIGLKREVRKKMNYAGIKDQIKSLEKQLASLQKGNRKLIKMIANGINAL